MDINLTDINKVVEDVDSRMSYFSEIGDPIIAFYTNDLDGLMTVIDGLMKNKTEELNINELQYYFMKLTSELYFVTTNVEKIGLLMDLSNLTYKDAFNTSLLNNSSAILSAVSSHLS